MYIVEFTWGHRVHMDAHITPFGDVVPDGPLVIGGATMKPVEPPPEPATGTILENATGLARDTLQSFRTFSETYRASSGILIGMVMILVVLAVSMGAHMLQRGAHSKCKVLLAKLAWAVFEALLVGVTVVAGLALLDLAPVRT